MCCRRTSVYVQEASGEYNGQSDIEKRYDSALASSHIESFIEANTPQVFTKHHLKKVHQIRLFQMISIYGHQFRENKNERYISNKDLRLQILEKGKEFGIRNYPFPIQLSYFLIFFCPWLFGFMFPVLFRIWQFNKKHLSGRLSSKIVLKLRRIK